MTTSAPQTATSATELLARFNRPPVSVPLPGGGQLIARRPDLIEQATRGVMPLPLLSRISAITDALNPAEIDAMTDGRVKPDPAFVEFINRYAVIAVEAPRLVLTEAEATPDALWVEILPFTVRVDVLTQTMKGGPQLSSLVAAASFRPGEPAGNPAGSNGDPVPHAAVDAAGDH